MRRTLNRDPEVMLKVILKGAQDLKTIEKDLKYIGREGEIDMIGDQGQAIRDPDAAKGIVRAVKSSTRGRAQYWLWPWEASRRAVRVRDARGSLEEATKPLRQGQHELAKFTLYWIEHKCLSALYKPN